MYGVLIRLNAAINSKTECIKLFPLRCADPPPPLRYIVYIIIQGTYARQYILTFSDSALKIIVNANTWRERDGSVVECLTRNRGAAGSSLTHVTALWSLSKTHLS